MECGSEHQPAKQQPEPRISCMRDIRIAQGELWVMSSEVSDRTGQGAGRVVRQVQYAQLQLGWDRVHITGWVGTGYTTLAECSGVAAVAHRNRHPRCGHTNGSHQWFTPSQGLRRQPPLAALYQPPPEAQRQPPLKAYHQTPLEARPHLGQDVGAAIVAAGVPAVIAAAVAADAAALLAVAAAARLVVFKQADTADCLAADASQQRLEAASGLELALIQEKQRA
eukprot:365650-Chlamydomonas_euryale.AAC.2